MENGNEDFIRDFYQTLEKSIGSLPHGAREELYRPCAEGCVKRYVLAEQQRQFDECGRDLDLQYERYGKSEYFFAEIIEKGRVYEIGYPVSACVCPMAAAGLASSPVHCECSRQSMLCVLQTLLPGKHITVETVRTVLSGGGECRFRVVVE